MTEEEWLSGPIGELLHYAYDEIATVPSQWLEVLWRVQGTSSPPRRNSPWTIGSRGRKHWLLILAITRLYWDYLSPPSREMVEWLQQNEEQSCLPSDEAIQGLDSYSLVDQLVTDCEALPLAAQLAGMNEASGLSGLIWTDIEFDSPPERYESWRPWIYDVFGNPFRPVSADPRWLTSTVVALAEGIYQDLAFDRMPILADALEEAGCDNADILSHCRGDGPHVRGCWVVDLLTGRK